MLNAMTVDLEDWGQAVLGPDEPLTDHVVGNVERLLEFLDRHGVRATFFALGKVCEKFPELLLKVAAAGHEIGSHGYGHELVTHLTPERFEADIARSVAIIEAQIGHQPVGYRAPAFSITEQTRWAGPILADHGFGYSSSIFPVRKKRYGIPDGPRHPHRWPNCDLIEFPLTTLKLWGKTNLPVCGGGYTRLFPARVHAWAMARMNDAGQPAVVYLHPYEMAVDEVTDFRRGGFSVSRKRDLMQSLWRSRVAPRLEFLFERFSFAPMHEVLDTISCSPREDTSSSPTGIQPSSVDSILEPFQL